MFSPLLSLSVSSFREVTTLQKEEAVLSLPSMEVSYDGEEREVLTDHCDRRSSAHAGHASSVCCAKSRSAAQ